MANVTLIESMEDFLEYNQIIKLLHNQMIYINSPKTNEEIMHTIKMALNSEQTKLMVISDGGHPIGFVFFNISIGMESAGKYVWLNEMHIHKEYRGKGYGTILFNELKTWCKEQNILRIMGMADDSEADTIHFYQKQQCKTYEQTIFSIYLNE